MAINFLVYVCVHNTTDKKRQSNTNQQKKKLKNIITLNNREKPLEEMSLDELADAAAATKPVPKALPRKKLSTFRDKPVEDMSVDEMINAVAEEPHKPQPEAEADSEASSWDDEKVRQMGWQKERQTLVTERRYDKDLRASSACGSTIVGSYVSSR